MPMGACSRGDKLRSREGVYQVSEHGGELRMLGVCVCVCVCVCVVLGSSIVL
jgi:hypothetical protein